MTYYKKKVMLFWYFCIFMTNGLCQEVSKPQSFRIYVGTSINTHTKTEDHMSIKALINVFSNKISPPKKLLKNPPPPSSNIAKDFPYVLPVILLGQQLVKIGPRSAGTG